MKESRPFGFKLILPWLGFGLRLTICFPALCFIYLLFAVADCEWGLDGMVNLFLIQPIFAVFLSGLTIALCLLAGLPFRLIPGWKKFFRRYGALFVFGILLGGGLLFASLVPANRHRIEFPDGEEIKIKQVPSPTLALSGWFTVAFCLLHVKLPVKI